MWTGCCQSRAEHRRRLDVEEICLETRCRVDQYVRLDRDRGWHIERDTLWRALVKRGLRRCSFGVESGVDSTSAKPNKETAGHQNAPAMRALTSLGVPPG
ncbi:hypothetical protein [Kibdelosporangium aridum]|uniref:hypothetical protein n=1 Tax=Kibdelosporangium aridum TaxID=2030 RepID=UPI000524A898